MTKTTDHIKALLVDDGCEFAMIRKTDLAALMQIAESDPHQGRFLDPIGEHRARAREDAITIEVMRKGSMRMLRDAFKHGEERHRYMANNKALQVRVTDLESQGIDDALEAFHLQNAIIDGCEREAALEARLLRVARFKRKFPAIGALMDVAP